jgi:AdoMet-dependent heme synthase
MDRSMEPGSFRPNSPFHMVWLATNLCNARCAHCSSNSSTSYPDELSREEACDLMDQLADAGVVDLAVSGGEPLLRQDLFEIIAHARSRGLSVGVGSNGAVLSQETAIRLVDSGINRFQVSLDGQAAEHDALRCWNGLFNRAVHTIEMARNVGLRVHVCCTINRLNWQILESFTELVYTLGVSRLNYSRFVPTGRGAYVLDLSSDEWRSVILLCGKLKERYKGKLEIVSHLAQQILVDAEIRDMPGFIGCQAGIGQGAVSANGYVFPCVLLPIPLGNIRQKRFLEIWQTSPVIQALQNRENLQGHCSQCHLRSRCGGCRAVAYARTGDYLESDPRCWLTPDAKAQINSKLETKEAICYV